MTEEKITDEQRAEIEIHRDLLLKQAFRLEELLGGSKQGVNFRIRSDHPHDKRFETILTVVYETKPKEVPQW